MQGGVDQSIAMMGHKCGGDLLPRATKNISQIFYNVNVVGTSGHLVRNSLWIALLAPKRQPALFLPLVLVLFAMICKEDVGVCRLILYPVLPAWY